MTINETHESRNWLKVETAILIFIVLAFIVTLAVLSFVGWPSDLPDNFSNRLRADKFFDLRNQLIKARLETVTTIALVLGVLAILFNVYYTAKRTEALDKSANVDLENVELEREKIRLTEQQLELSREKARLAEQQLELSRENTRLIQQGQITERFTKAIEQLGYDHLPIRLGGIYVLERIANNAQTDQSRIVEILAAFVRENAPLNTQLDKKNTETPQRPPTIGMDLQKGEDTEPPPKLRTDIQAALTVIGRRDLNKDLKNQRLDLNNTDLGGALLSSANLSGAFLKGTNLQRADLLQADLAGALLSSANLTGAFLMGANLVGVVFRGANLAGAFFMGANLLGADLREANLSGAFLMGANLLGADLREANLSGADLSEAENLEPQQIESAKGDSTTSLPDNIKAPINWMQWG